MRKVLLSILVVLILFLGILFFNYFTFESKQIAVEPIPTIEIPNIVVENLSKAIQIPTISKPDSGKIDTIAFQKFHQYLKTTFPFVHQNLQIDTIQELSLVFTWKGKNTSLNPILLLAHQDIVPVETAGLSEWTNHPYEGKIDEEFIWGRGSMDDKVSVLGILEACELKLSKGFQPERTFLFCFGHDEEVGGEGAKSIARFLTEKGIKAEMILDEGMVITHGMMPGVESPIALIGIAEKGYVSYNLTAETEGGHSSMPTTDNAVANLSKGVSTLTDNQMPSSISGSAELLFKTVAPEMGFLNKLLFANLWLTESIILSQLEAKNTTNAMVRTTTAPTMLKSGVKDNVLPTKAEGVVNFRIKPEENIASVDEHLHEHLEQYNISFKQLKGGFGAEPSSVSPAWGDETFERFYTTVKGTYPDVIVAPSLVIAATDARHYEAISTHIYRFLPLQLEKEDLSRIHGIDERISIRNYKEIIQFYYNCFEKL